MTLWPLAHEWQTAHGALGLEQRLVPKRPFVLGGDFAASNLHAVDAVRAMHFYGDLSRQIHELPDGTPINLKVID